MVYWLLVLFSDFHDSHQVIKTDLVFTTLEECRRYEHSLASKYADFENEMTARFRAKDPNHQPNVQFQMRRMLRGACIPTKQSSNMK